MHSPRRRKRTAFYSHSRLPERSRNGGTILLRKMEEATMSFDLGARPEAGEYGDFHAGYIAAVPIGDIRETLGPGDRGRRRLLRRDLRRAGELRLRPRQVDDPGGRWRTSPTASASSPTGRCASGAATARRCPASTRISGCRESHAATRRWEELQEDFAPSGRRRSTSSGRSRRRTGSAAARRAASRSRCARSPGSSPATSCTTGGSSSSATASRAGRLSAAPDGARDRSAVR